MVLFPHGVYILEKQGIYQRKISKSIMSGGNEGFKIRWENEVCVYTCVCVWCVFAILGKMIRAAL